MCTYIHASIGLRYLEAREDRDSRRLHCRLGPTGVVSPSTFKNQEPNPQKAAPLYCSRPLRDPTGASSSSKFHPSRVPALALCMYIGTWVRPPRSKKDYLSSFISWNSDKGRRKTRAMIGRKVQRLRGFNSCLGTFQLVHAPHAACPLSGDAAA